MKVFRVQFAYAQEVGCPSIHRDEESAKGQVAYLLGQWLSKNLAFKVRELERKGQSPEFTADGRRVLAEIPERLSRGDVWGAYDLWQDFYDRYETVFEWPLYVSIGTVFVDTTEAEPLRKRRTLPVTDIPPMIQYSKGEKPTVVGHREDLEMALMLSDIASQLKAAGRSITEKELEEHYEEAAKDTERIGREEFEKGRKLAFSDLTQIFEREFKRRLGLEGR